MLIKENYLNNVINEVINDWEIKTNIDNIIYEELGISSKVSSTSNNIINKIQSLLPSLKSEKNEDGVFIKSGYLEEDIIGNKLSISFKVYNFLNYKSFEINKEKYQDIIATANSSFNNKVSLLWINVYAISGTIQKKQAMENIQHEIEHIFQQKNAKKNLPKQEYYGIVRQKLTSSDKIEQSVAVALYYAYHFESDGFANGLSGYINDEPFPITWEDLKNTDAYKAFKNSKQNFSYLKKISKEELVKYLEPYNLSINKFFDRIIHGQEYFIHKIGKILALHRNNLNENGIYLSRISEKTIHFY